MRWPNGESAPKRFVATVVPMTQTGRPPAASAAEKKCPAEMPTPDVGRYCSVVPTICTRPELRRSNSTFAPDSATGATADDSVSCPATVEASASLNGRRRWDLRQSPSLLLNHALRSTKNTSAPNDEMLLMKERFNPSMAVPIKVTVTMPMTMPSVVRMERSLLARIAAQEMPKPSRISVMKFIAWVG